MIKAAFFVIIASLAALLVVGTEDMRSGHVVFANRGIKVQTDTTQDQGCENSGSGITNSCTATSGSTQTRVTLNFEAFISGTGGFTLSIPTSPNFCNNIGCQSITCVGSFSGVSYCTTNNGVQLTSCTGEDSPLTCTLTEPGTGTTNSGGVSGGGGG